MNLGEYRKRILFYYKIWYNGKKIEYTCGNDKEVDEIDRIYAFISHTGNSNFHSFHRENPYFTVTAVLVKESEREQVQQAAETAHAYWELPEGQQAEFLAEAAKSPFKILTICIDKERFILEQGFCSEQGFFAFVNHLVYEECRRRFQKLTIVMEETDTFSRSFAAYVRANEEIPNLFGEREFYFQEGRGELLLQFAKCIGDAMHPQAEAQQTIEKLQAQRILGRNLLDIEQYPKDAAGYQLLDQNATENDKIIAELCLKRAQDFIKENAAKEDESIKNQVWTLKYLAFRFINQDASRYIYTKELIQNLNFHSAERISIQKFRTTIIARLRDQGVIIASCAKGYKIPSKEKELYDFIHHGTTIIIPMVHRLKLCRDVIKEGTDGALDLFERPEYEQFRAYLEKL